MVYHQSSISACNSTHHSPTGNTTLTVAMSDSIDSTNHVQKKGKTLNSSIQPSCSQSQSAIIDIIILISVIGAFGFLLYPCVIFTYVKFREIVDLFLPLVIEEILENPLIYGSLGLSTMCVTAAVWAIVACMSRKCGNPDCLGLKNAAEFDIQLETEECVKNSNVLAKNSVKKGLFQLPRDHHRELEGELRKMAPVNGRAILVFRAKCGCSVGRMEVPGLRKTPKMKK